MPSSQPSAPESTSAKPPRWERRKEARPAEILEAALDLFVEKGYANTRGEDVAARAGVSKGTLYLYFSNKEELFKAVVRQNILPTIAEAGSLIEQYQGPTAALLGEILRGWWQRIGTTKAAGICKLVTAESGNFPAIWNFYYAEVVEPGDRLLKAVIQRGIDRGEFRPVDVPATVHTLRAPILMLMMWQGSGGPCSVQVQELGAERMIEAMVDVVTHGLVLAQPAAAEPA